MWLVVTRFRIHIGTKLAVLGFITWISKSLSKGALVQPRFATTPSAVPNTNEKETWWVPAAVHSTVFTVTPPPQGLDEM